MIDAVSFKEINSNYNSQCITKKSFNIIVYIFTD